MNRRLVIALSSLLIAPQLFAAGKQLTGQHAPASTPALPPAEAQKSFQTLEGFEVRLFAAEPDVINPVAMTWDERGRLWVIELYEYPLGAPEGQKPRDCIKILEDTDNDGRADKVKVFADGLNLATGLLLGNGGVYLGEAPNLVFLEDTDGDDVADKRTVLLTGFGLHDRHELLNGFTWGPDGWIYMTHGVFTHSNVKIPEATTPGVDMNAAVARFHPGTKKFEIFAEGTSNPWGVDFDKYGNAFVSACVIDHLFHMAPGGTYQRQAGAPANPYAYELLPSIVDHKHHMAAYCGVCVYEGDQYPAEYRGRVFMGNIHENALNHDRLIPNGSSFKAVAEPNFLKSTDGWFMPVSEQVGPDGAVWVADWYDKYPCYQNAQADPEGVDRARGRIWRVLYTGKDTPGSRPEKGMDLKKLKSEELVKVLEHPNVWQRRTAQRLLMERIQTREDAPTTSALLNIMDSSVRTASHLPEARISAFWVLQQFGNHIPLFVYSTANRFPDDSWLRDWMAARQISEHRDASSEALAVLEKLASHTDPRVRFAVALACRQLVSSSLTINTDINTQIPVGKVLTALTKSSADAKDPLIPYMIWLASEPLFAANPGPGLKWVAENGASAMPLSGILTRKAMRRICDSGDAAKMDKAIEFLAAAWGKNDDLIIAALDGLIEGQKAKPLRPTMDTQALLAKGNEGASEKVRERLQQLGALWGDAAATEKTLASINNSSASNEERIKAIQSAKQFKNDATREALLKLILSGSPEPLVVEALQSLGAIADDPSAAQLVKNWNKLSPNTRRVAAETLASRPHWGRLLLDGLEDKVISPSDISATVARALFTSKNPNFVARAERLLGRFREADADKLKVIAAKKTLVLSGQPDFKNGQEVAKRTCFVCHKLLGEGAEVGPDLTGVGRSTLDALLANVIDPNQVIGIGYENVEVETKDGRIVGGRMVENTGAHVKLLAAGPVENVVAKSDIESMRVSELSVMPEGLEQMSETDFRDMIWYILAPPQEGPLTPERRSALVGK
jgi:putative membrane-bound dehydrogenase-like protein